MRVARSDSELNKLILADIKAAISQAEEKALGDMFEATNGFYTGSPKKYKRTFALGTTPRTEKAGGDAGFRAYLDTSYTYGTGSHPGMEKVLGWAEVQAAGIVGGPLRWDDAESKIIADTDAALKEYFV